MSVAASVQRPSLTLTAISSSMGSALFFSTLLTLFIASANAFASTVIFFMLPSSLAAFLLGCFSSTVCIRIVLVEKSV